MASISEMNERRCAWWVAALMLGAALISLQWMQEVQSRIEPSLSSSVDDETSAAEEANHSALPMSYANYPVPYWVADTDFIVDPALVLAIVKKESNFNLDAASHKGARGLMQIMPKTAGYIVERARKNHNPTLAMIKPSDFARQDVNLALGQHYLTYLAEKPYIDNNLIYVLTAYNAGPGNLRKWQKQFGHLQGDAFIDAIPYAETRHYVRKVMQYYAQYQTVLADQEWMTAAASSALLFRS